MPPLTGVQVYVTEVPEQTGLAEAVIVALTGSDELTVIVIVFDVAGFPVAQTSFEVIVQVTKSPFTGI